MKFLFGFISATMFIAIVFITCWLYFDLPIDTNDETETYTPPQEVQQEMYNDHIEQTSPNKSTAESSVYLTSDELHEYEQLKQKTELAMASEENPKVSVEERERLDYLTSRIEAEKQLEEE